MSTVLGLGLKILEKTLRVSFRIFDARLDDQKEWIRVFDARLDDVKEWIAGYKSEMDRCMHG